MRRSEAITRAQLAVLADPSIEVEVWSRPRPYRWPGTPREYRTARAERVDQDLARADQDELEAAGWRFELVVFSRSSGRAVVFTSKEMAV